MLKEARTHYAEQYCTSGDLSTLIRKADRSGQPIPEDKIWNIFLQLTLALHHCHWPAERPVTGSKGGVGRLSGGISPVDAGGMPRYQVLHRDLKPENGTCTARTFGCEAADRHSLSAYGLDNTVFLSDDFVKLGDFGLSKDMGTAAFTSTYVGVRSFFLPNSNVRLRGSQTPLYMPPEILGGNRYDTKSDIWSLGCLIFELCALTYVV